MFRNLKITIRNLRRSGVYTVINVVGLALSLATCVFIILWIQDERSYDRFHKDAASIYMAVAHFDVEGNKFIAEASSGIYAPAAKDNFGSVEEYCRVRSWGAGFLRYGDIKSSPINCFYSDPNFFDFFNFPIVKGNRNNPLQNPNDVVINERLAKELFGEEDPVGKTASLDNGRPIHVTAVMKEMPQNTYLRKTDLVSLFAIDTASYYSQMLNTWDGCEFLSFVRLRTGTDHVQLAEQISDQQPEGWKVFRSFRLQPLINLHLYSIEGEPAGLKTVRMFQWIALVILVIASINYVNLVTARSSKRHREIGLKKVIGAKKMQLFLQLISEAAVLFVIAIVIALLLNLLLLPVFNQLSGKQIVFDLFDLNIWTVYLMMLLAVVGLAGIYPAWLLASFKATNVVQTIKTKRGSTYFRRTLVVAQFVASTALIVGTIVLGAQMKYIREKDMGYDREHVLMCNLGNMADHFDAVKAELEQQTSITGVTAASENIMQVGSGNAFGDWEGKTSEGISMHSQLRIDTSFVNVMRLTLADGAGFTSTTEPQYILNEAAVKTMGLTDPVGKWVGQQESKIVGVVKDFHFASLHSNIEPLVMFYDPRFIRTLYVRTAPGKVQDAIAAVEKLSLQYNPEYAFNYSFLDETFDSIYKSDILTGRLFSIFSFIAILISCLGLFGLVVFTAGLKTKEIGIRKVLGASIFDIVKLLTNEFLILVGIAMLIALPLSFYWLDTMLQDYVYRISLSWWMFAAATLITIALTLLTVYTQAIKAAMKNPVEAIKTE
jgi:ABC-type lipoprotein release transport system permease subunit